MKWLSRCVWIDRPPRAPGTLGEHQVILGIRDLHDVFDLINEHVARLAVELLASMHQADFVVGNASRHGQPPLSPENNVRGLF
jgi:hypothetical protein